MSGQTVLFIGYGLAAVLYGGFFVRNVLKRRSLQAQLVALQNSER